MWDNEKALRVTLVAMWLLLGGIFGYSLNHTKVQHTTTTVTVTQTPAACRAALLDADALNAANSEAFTDISTAIGSIQATGDYDTARIQADTNIINADIARYQADRASCLAVAQPAPSLSS